MIRADLFRKTRLGSFCFGAGGRGRTDTDGEVPRILSPVRLPFRHTGMNLRMRVGEGFFASQHRCESCIKIKFCDPCFSTGL